MHFGNSRASLLLLRVEESEFRIDVSDDLLQLGGDFRVVRRLIFSVIGCRRRIIRLLSLSSSDLELVLSIEMR